MVDVRPLRTEADYDWALTEIEPYFRNEPALGSPDADRFDVLAELIEAYEAKHWPIASADPIEAIRHRMQLADYSQKDLANLLGSRSRASEILARKRPLTVAMIYKLATEWSIPADALIAPYHTDAAQEAEDITPRPQRSGAGSR